jgi:dethiobiotin synthetase
VDIARRLAAPVLIVARAGLGTLNAVALTADVLATRGLTCKGVVIGAWPASPDLAAEHNLDDLPAYANAPLLGAVPAGAGVSPARDRFLRIARVSIAPALGGTWVRRPVG